MLRINIGSPIEEKIAWAKASFQKVKGKLLQDYEIKILLNKFRLANQNTRQKIKEIRLTHECKQCALSGESCCRRGIENRYDTVILLINKLLGVKLPARRLYPDGCYFLSSDGCMLVAREIICVDYLCRRVLDRIEHKKIVELQQIAGQEMDIFFNLQERIKQKLLSSHFKARHYYAEYERINNLYSK